MPKRSKQEKIDHYRRKLRRLQCVTSSSDNNSETEELPILDEEPDQDANQAHDPEVIPTDMSQSELPPPAADTEPGNTVTEDVPPVNPAPTDTANVPALDQANPPAGTSLPGSNPAPEPPSPELDPELLSALGEPTDDSPKFGEKIHHNLAQRWLPLLRKGLSKESKEKLLKDYLVPENCTLLQAPKLNAEIAAAITEMARNRDKKMETAQQQLGVGITAINKALTLLLTSDDKISAIKQLSDACRILTDLHFTETQARIKLITPGLAKPFLNIIQDSDRDDTLFGNKLPEKIKASKAIERQGLQIKKPLTNTNSKTASTSGSSTTTRTSYQNQGNWSGPSRYSSNRGGRGGPKKAPTPARKPPAQPQTRPAGQGKPRAPTQQ